MKKKVERSAMLAAIMVIISFAASFAVIFTAAIPQSYDYKAGDICEEDIYAPREVEDKATTNRRREAAAAQVGRKTKINYDITADCEEELGLLFTAVSEARSMDISTDGKIRFAAEGSGADFSYETLSFLVTAEGEVLSAFTKTVQEVFSEIMDKGVSDADAAFSEAKELLSEKALPEVQASAAEELLEDCIKVNEVYDEELTNAEIEKAKSMVEPTVYKKNQVILRKGEAVTDTELELLTELGLMKGGKSISIKYAAGILIFLLLVYALGAYHMRKKEFGALRTEKLCITLLLPLLCLLIVMLCTRLNGIGAFLIPIPVGAVLTATFVNMEMSVLCSVYVCSAATIMLSEGAEYIAAMLLFSVLAAAIFKRVSGLSAYAGAMLLTALTGALTAAMAALFLGKGGYELLRFALFGAANGIITSVIAIGTTPIFENAFNIITPFKLNDLGNPEKPLLKRLMFEAPGTYHHSLMVGNLAEAACIKIGADNQLARVGAYYHDIGKLKKPEYFFENQMGVNPHDALMPEESAAVLHAHVNYGAEIAKQYRLPRGIKDIIAQHHGTTLAGFFYTRAKELDENADEAAFRYPGPKPESKEAGIVMLADSCEAAVRSLDEKTEASIRAMVTKIVRSKMADGQLDECKLSFRELGEITEAFVTMLESYFHKRIKYDKEPENGADN